MVVDDIFLQVKKIHHEAEYFMTKTDRNSYINLLRKILNRSKDINQLEAISKIQNEFQQIKINHKPEAITDELTRLSAMISNPDIFPVSENFKSFTTTIELGSFLKSKISKTFDEINKYATELILERKNILEEIIQQMKQCLKSLNDEFTLLSGLHESKEQKKALDFVKQFNILEQNFKLQGKNTPVFKSHFPQNNEIYEQFQKFDHEIRIMVEEISDVEQKLTNYNTNVTRIAESIEKCISADLFDALIKVIDGGEYKSDLYSIFSRGRSRFLQHVLENLEALSVESASCKDIEHSKALFAKAEELNEKTKELYTMKFQWAVSENDVEETGILDRIKSNIKIIESNNNSIVEDEKPKAANKFQAMKEKVRKRG